MGLVLMRATVLLLVLLLICRGRQYRRKTELDRYVLRPGLRYMASKTC
jgi:hypothetical protein